MREDYQALIDEVSQLLGTPATLEGRDFSLIAFGAHESGDEEGQGLDLALDAVRTRTILQRRSAPAVRAFFENYGITRATGPVRIPPDPAAGVVHGRICLPVRDRGVVYGYIWLLDDGALDLADPRLTAAMTVAERTGAQLAAHFRAEERTGELLSAALAERGGGARDEAVAGLAAALGDAAAGPLALVAVLPWEQDEHPRSSGQSPLTGALPRLAAQCVRDGALAALVRLRTPHGLDAARAAAGRLLRSAGPQGAGDGGPTAGLSTPRTGLAGLPTAWREARAAARAAAAEPPQDAIAEWDAIGPYRLLTGLAPTGPVPDPVVHDLLRPVHHELARTAEVFLDCAGQAGRSAAALGIHRQTLYYRLTRVERLTGLDLDEGEDRLLLHMALKAARL
ncbi:PucR family transcriptional regulator [Streptomyces reniochalinae]|uniref:PucR family transcriptional regulator n=1 Tax=Streptomyces reniochalinae TaxID=2250578 RepID=A0A367EL48_9ACTN|nr:helix-turn-helix domain-containing protein [Streptomyces reniochalinae]RCG18489.1 PucR family transcriptional regulator [Streptomyces reniochalinae]